jgi:phage gpG-like protein
MLKLGIMHWLDDNNVFIGPGGPAIPYARIQQKGGQTGKGGATVIPARPFLIVLPENKTYIRDFIRGELLDA